MHHLKRILYMFSLTLKYFLSKKILAYHTADPEKSKSMVIQTFYLLNKPKHFKASVLELYPRSYFYNEEE